MNAFTNTDGKAGVPGSTTEHVAGTTDVATDGFAALVDRFCREQADFRAGLARVGGRGDMPMEGQTAGHGARRIVGPS